MSGTILYNTDCISQVPSRNCQDSLERYILFFFLNEEEFVSRTISDSNIDSNKFLASKVCQLAKKMESSKATAKHIKHIASDPQVVQVNVLCHQHTEIPPSKSNKKNRTFTFRQEANKFDEDKPRMTQKIEEDLILSTQDQTDVHNVVNPNTEKSLGVEQACTSVRCVTNLATSVACTTRREMACIISKGPWVHPGHTN